MSLYPVGTSQYAHDFFRKLDIDFVQGRQILDVGCGNGKDGRIFIDTFGLKWRGVDIYRDQDVVPLGKSFSIGNIFSLRYPANYFDYVFMHDVLHHVDETYQRQDRHELALRQLRRVCKRGGLIIIAEGNRYNPLFYPHMVKMHGHEHFKQSYFIHLMNTVFAKDKICFKFYEAHLYPTRFRFVFIIYEWIMEHIGPHQFLAYNIAIITKR